MKNYMAHPRLQKSSEHTARLVEPSVGTAGTADGFRDDHLMLAAAYYITTDDVEYIAETTTMINTDLLTTDMALKPLKEKKIVDICSNCF